MRAKDLFESNEALGPLAEHFDLEAPPWEWLSQIKAALGHYFSEHSGKNQIYIHPEARVDPLAKIEGPAYIGAKAEVRAFAQLRGNTIVGAASTVGHACELKHSLLLGKVEVPHFNYVGDSILGNQAHLGAGAIIANQRLDKKPIHLKLPSGERHQLKSNKFGALLADGAQLGCNAVSQPGTIIDRGAIVLPTVSFSGYLAPSTIATAESKTETHLKPES